MNDSIYSLSEGTHFTPPQAISNYHARRAPRAVGPVHRAPMRLLVLLLASASALMPTADGMSGARPLTRAPALGRPRPVYRLAPSQLCAVQPLPPAPVSRWQQVVGSGSWRVGAVTALICLDILCYSFPLPFMPEFLASRCVRHPHSPGLGPEPSPRPSHVRQPEPTRTPAPARRGHTPRDTSVLLSSFSFAALASGATIVVAQSTLPARGGDVVRRRCALLAMAAMAMAAVSAAQATLPSYGSLSPSRRPSPSLPVPVPLPLRREAY